MNPWKNIPGVKAAGALAFLPTENRFLHPSVPVRIIRSRGEPITRIDIIYQAGGRYQSRTFEASYTNQMLMEGTDRMSASDIAGELDYLGSYVTPGTDRDEAEISLSCLDKHLEPTLALVLELLTRPVFGENNLEIVKSKRIQQMEIDLQRVEAISRKHLMQAIFGSDHPYGKWGEIAEAAAIESSWLREFHKNYYPLAKARILVSTNDPDHVFRLLERMVLPLIQEESPGTASQKFALPALHATAGKRILINKADARQTAIRMGKSMVPRSHPDFGILSLLTTILGGYFGSRLMKKIREEKGYTYGIGAWLSSMKEHGYLVISSSVRNDVWEETLNECNSEIRRLCDTRISQKELTLVRNYLSGDLQRKLDGALAQADIMRTLWVHHFDFSEISRFHQMLHECTPEELREAARRYLDPASLIEVVCTG